VILGHSQCGAVTATIEELRNPSDSAHSRNLRSIVGRIQPAVQGLLAELAGDEHTLLHEACRANVRASANQLRHGSEIIEKLCAEDGLLIVGAEYSLETGVVDVFEKP
jgi:carbonic anhydrase